MGVLFGGRSGGRVRSRPPGDPLEDPMYGMSSHGTKKRTTG